MHLDLKSRLRLGVSSCLTGDAVRYDGTHRRDHWVMDRLAAFSDLHAVCPEAILGIPRETLSLVRETNGRIGVRGDMTGTDFSARLDKSIRADLDALPIHDQKQVAYRSQNPGVLHAFGHAGHSATVLGALLAIRQLGQREALPWPCRARGIFQPEEETALGAAAMIAA